MEAGSRVRFSSQHLKSTGQHTGPEAPASYGPFAEGTVREVYGQCIDYTLVIVEWDTGEKNHAIMANLEEAL